MYKTVLLADQSTKRLVKSRGRPIIGADIKHFTDYRYRPFSKHFKTFSNLKGSHGNLSKYKFGLAEYITVYVIQLQQLLQLLLTIITQYAISSMF